MQFGKFPRLNLLYFKSFERERGGVAVEHLTPNREVLGSIPTGGTVLCP